MHGRAITFFEITGAAMFLAFSRHPADAVVLEVGLGGTYDATNVVPQSGHDHRSSRWAWIIMEFLGNDLAGIAAEKAGIIKTGVPVVVGPQDEIAARSDPAPRRPAGRAGCSCSARISPAARNMAAWSMRTRRACWICRCPG